MKKIKVFSSHYENELTKLVNEYIEREKIVNVLDIKFSTHVVQGAYNPRDWENWVIFPEEVFNAMIIYESEV